MAILHYGSMALQHYDTSVLRHYDTMALRHYGTTASKKNLKRIKTKSQNQEYQQNKKISKISSATYISDVVFFKRSTWREQTASDVFCEAHLRQVFSQGLPPANHVSIVFADSASAEYCTTFTVSVSQSVSQSVSHRRDISAFLHCARFWTTQTIYFLKGNDIRTSKTKFPGV